MHTETRQLEYVLSFQLAESWVEGPVNPIGSVACQSLGQCRSWGLYICVECRLNVTYRGVLGLLLETQQHVFHLQSP